MADLVEVWKEVLPGIREGVTGVGVWSALNGARPVAVENGFIVLGLAPKDGELAGHLRAAQTKKLIETAIGARFGEKLELRIIEGTSKEDWERAKRRDTESQRLQHEARERTKSELAARTNWDSVYEQLSRRYAAVTNKTIPMSRARYLQEAIGLLAEARGNQESSDDLADRNFARCIERVAQYTELPSTLVALHVLKATGEL